MKPTSLAQCQARCTICRKVYKYNLNSKGNLLKHLQNVHKKYLDKHKEDRAKHMSENEVPANQCTLDKEGRVKVTHKPKEPFKNQDQILKSIVKNVSDKGCLPLCIVEQDWFLDFMKLVKSRFQNMSRVSVSSRLEEIYQEERRNILDEISKSVVCKPM